jgi:pimeloyl-ACP methyl ester carboxylesterase
VAEGRKVMDIRLFYTTTSNVNSTMLPAKTVEIVLTEEAEIYCERRGDGPLLLLITGAMGDAGYYSYAADILAKEFTVVTYDRRCNSRSTGDRTVDMTMAQQARDAAAIVSVMGFGKALVFGSSGGGGFIALELAASRPDLVNFLIAHEAPIIEVLPDAEKWRSLNNDIYVKSQKEGWKVALADFMGSLVNAPSIAFPPDLKERVYGNIGFFFKHEFKSLIGHVPDFKRIQENGVDMVVAVGAESDDAYYERSTREIASRLGCACVKFPGQHCLLYHVRRVFKCRKKHDKPKREQETLVVLMKQNTFVILCRYQVTAFDIKKHF